MKENRMTEAMNFIDDDLITAAAQGGVAKKKGSIVKIARFGTIAACFSLLVASLLMRQNGSFEKIFSTEGGAAHGNFEVSDDKIKINKVGSIASQDIDGQSHLLSDKLPIQVWRQEMERFKDFIGTDYDSFVANAGDTLSLETCYSFYTKGIKDGNPSDEYSLHDYVFQFSGTAENARFVLAVSSEGKPLRDCFIEEKNPKESVINGCRMYIHNYEGTYMAQFSHNGINYDVEASNVTLEEFVDFVRAYIQ